MEPRTAKARLKAMAEVLRSQETIPEEHRRLCAHWCEEIINTLNGLVDANAGIARLEHKGPVR